MSSDPSAENLSTNTPPVSSSKTTSKKIKTKIIVFSILAGVVSIFAILIVYVLVQINLPKNPTDSAQVVFKVEQGNGIEDIAKSLKDKGLINDTNIFVLYARFGPSRGNLKPGVYSLSPSMSLASIADTLGAGKIATKKVTFQEGLTIEGMARKWAKDGLGTAQSFNDAANLQNTYKQAFLQYRSNRSSLEGYLFPATYDVVLATTSQEQINTMLDAFASQVLPKLDPAIANSTKLSDIVTLASIVEKEANTTADRKLVASVFYNRLNKGMRLESDVTINYVTGKTATEASDLRISSPYNSYRNFGLPPTPICNPSLDAILATANPTTSDYYYFIADKSGVVHFTKTYQEHLQNIEKYLN